ncbi:hypothetical protein OG943_24090 [Amycolatopsis sp. NBC_00345]|uniref:hypothetical protein n=1 Tax=Amycolatopsis sp. NBC_00345 TaxID=2975955 RepID=UPI002E255B31
MTDLIRECDDVIQPRPIHALPAGLTWELRETMFPRGAKSAAASQKGLDLMFVDGRPIKMIMFFKGMSAVSSPGSTVRASFRGQAHSCYVTAPVIGPIAYFAAGWVPPRATTTGQSA